MKAHPDSLYLSVSIAALCLWLAPLVRGLTGKLSRRH